MARHSRPWWWKARNRWAVNISGRRLVAPASIGRDDHVGAALWHRQVLDVREPISASCSVAELCEAYLEWDYQRVRAGQRDADSHRATCSKLTRFCQTRLGVTRIGEMRAHTITASHLARCVEIWSENRVALGYQRDLCASAKAAWSWAARKIETRQPSQILPRNPLIGFRTPSPPIPEERFATRDEAAVWLRWLWRRGMREYALLQRCLIHTGARPSEWTRATWGEIRWDADPMPVLTRRVWKAARKTGKPRRIFIPPRLVRSLRRRLGDPGDLIFTAPRGGPWKEASLAQTTRRLRMLAIADGIPLQDEGPDRLTCYRWRHTAASNLLMHGVDISTIAQLLGTSVHQISRTYGHLLSDHLAIAAGRLARGK